MKTQGTMKLAAAVATVIGFAGAAMAAPFGNKEDVDYAAELWKEMQAAGLAGPGAIHTIPYEGTEPHGMMLETFYARAKVGGHEGDLVVKRNYGPAGVEADAVMMAPDKHLGAVTVMFRREKGYDPDNQDWFWVKYAPDGSVMTNPKGMMLAGRVAKGADQGCIACHSGAPGDDYLFTTDAIGMEK